MKKPKKISKRRSVLGAAVRTNPVFRKQVVPSKKFYDRNKLKEVQDDI